MNDFQQAVQIVAWIYTGVVFVIFLLLYKLWLPKIRPNLFYRFNIFEHDLINYRTYLIFLPFAKDNDSYSFNKKTYIKKDCEPYIDNDGVFTWNFEFDKALPIYFRRLDTNINASLVYEAENTTIDKIYFSDNDIFDFIRKNIVFIGIILIGIIIVIMIFKGNAPTTAINTVPVK